MNTVWMVRAGEGSRLFDEFEKGYVAIGWNEMGDMSSTSDLESIRQRYIEGYPDVPTGALGNNVAMFHKFRSVMKVDDRVVTYDARNREYLYGSIKGDYM